LASLKEDGFDIATIGNMPPNVWMKNEIIVPHAYGFIYHEIMQDQTPPSVQVYLNAFYPPNQPSMQRSIDFGYALSRAIESWDPHLRVALIASGGMSHFVCDEDFDRSMLDIFQAGDLEALAAVDDRYYQSGTSEIKLYAPVIAAMTERGSPMTLVDYVPCYRTEAGTGEGMAFMYWKP
ncbi:MAG: protocatechuate 3,4-dioxygenase, partial [Methylocystaceae bacterium]|nr:protocatechuate 3,4-dioxygenase [Methylocystaceae bacterium]